jgi:hypothetical protein
MLELGHQLVVMMDDKADVRKYKVSSWMHDLNLRDVCIEKHGQ